MSLKALTQLARSSVSQPTVHERDPEASKLVFITSGTGINKLAALCWLNTHSLADARKDDAKRDDETIIDRD